MNINHIVKNMKIYHIWVWLKKKQKKKKEMPSLKKNYKEEPYNNWFKYAKGPK
jgi:hypothetical protein